MRAAALAALATISLTSACGGVDEPACPTDDCSIPGSTVIKWRFHEYPEWNFLADTCQDLGVTTVRVEAINVADPDVYVAVDKQCGEGQATLLRLAEGTYSVAVTPLDVAGNPAVSTPARGEVVAGVPGVPTESTVNVPYTGWTQAYTGTFLFKLSWAGMPCETASVATQTLKLLIGGQVVDKLVDNGQKLDGTDDKPCRSHTESFAQFATDLPFGPATLVVTGKDTNGSMRYERQFETFIGVGQNNPTLTFDVPAPAGM
ncbi:MAG: hypothetical protein M3680_19610 [Myxococcota bacterium]|nr:hypothetical protein [Myxococcota bacterium]